MRTSSKREQAIRVSSQSIVAVSPTERAIRETASALKNPRPLKRLQCKLRREQRRLSRKMPKSRNRENARIYVARLYERIVNIRKDFLHKLSTRLARENQTVAVEQQSLSARGDCYAESQALCKKTQYVNRRSPKDFSVSCKQDEVSVHPVREHDKSSSLQPVHPEAGSGRASL